MIKINRIRLRMVAILMAMLPVAACASQPQLPVRSVSEAADPLSIIWVHAYPSHDGVAVSGVVKRPRIGYAPIAGYIRVDALDGDNAILATEYFSVEAMTIRKKQGRLFSVWLPHPNASQIDHVEAHYVARMQQ